MSETSSVAEDPLVLTAYESNLDAIFRPPICYSPGQSRNPSAHNVAIEFLDEAAIKIYSYLELVCVHGNPRTHSALDYLHGMTGHHTNKRRRKQKKSEAFFC